MLHTWFSIFGMGVCIAHRTQEAFSWVSMFTPAPSTACWARGWDGHTASFSPRS